MDYLKNINIKPIGKRTSTWGEGPMWWKQYLYYVDIEGKSIIILNPKTEEEKIWKFKQRIGCVVATIKGDLLYSGDNGIFRFNPKTLESMPIANPEPNKPFNRFNDGKCDPYGRFWAGTINLKKQEGAASLYCLNQDEKIQLKLNDLTNSNGIAWSNNKEKMFHIDTPTKTVKSYDFDGPLGKISNPKILIDTEKNKIPGSPDGMTIDIYDNLWIAFCHGGCVACFDSKNGSLLNLIKLPISETTSCTFGGEDLNRLFVTTGINRKKEEKDAGRIFVIDGLPTYGRNTELFHG